MQNCMGMRWPANNIPKMEQPTKPRRVDKAGREHWTLDYGGCPGMKSTFAGFECARYSSSFRAPSP